MSRKIYTDDFNEDYKFFAFIKRNPEDSSAVENFKLHLQHIKKLHIVNIRNLDYGGNFAGWKKMCVIETKRQYYYTSYPYYYNRLKFIFKGQMKLRKVSRVVDKFKGGEREYPNLDKTYEIYMRGFYRKKLLTEPSVIDIIKKIDEPQLKKKRVYNLKRWHRLEKERKKKLAKRLAELEVVKKKREEKKLRLAKNKLAREEKKRLLEEQLKNNSENL